MAYNLILFSTSPLQTCLTLAIFSNLCSSAQLTQISIRNLSDLHYGCSKHCFLLSNDKLSILGTLLTILKSDATAVSILIQYSNMFHHSATALCLSKIHSKYIAELPRISHLMILSTYFISFMVTYLSIFIASFVAHFSIS